MTPEDMEISNEKDFLLPPEVWDTVTGEKVDDSPEYVPAPPEYGGFLVDPAAVRADEARSVDFTDHIKAAADSPAESIETELERRRTALAHAVELSQRDAKPTPDSVLETAARLEKYLRTGNISE